MSISSDGRESGEATIRQYGLRLVEGGKYRISAYREYIFVFAAGCQEHCGEENERKFQKQSHASMAFRWLMAGLAYMVSM